MFVVTLVSGSKLALILSDPLLDCKMVNLKLFEKLYPATLFEIISMSIVLATFNTLSFVGSE